LRRVFFFFAASNAVAVSFFFIFPYISLVTMSLTALPEDVLTRELVQWLPTQLAVDFYYRTCKHLRERCSDRAMRSALRTVQVIRGHFKDKVWFKCKWRSITFPCTVELYVLSGVCVLEHGDTPFKPEDGWVYPMPTRLRMPNARVKDAALLVAAVQRAGASITCIYLEASSPYINWSADTTAVLPPCLEVEYVVVSGCPSHWQDPPKPVTQARSQLRRQIKKFFPMARIIFAVEGTWTINPADMKEEEEKGADGQGTPTWPHRIRSFRVRSNFPDFGVFWSRKVSESTLRSLLARVDRVDLEVFGISQGWHALLLRILECSPPRATVHLNAAGDQPDLSCQLAPSLASRVTHLRVYLSATLWHADDVFKNAEKLTSVRVLKLVLVHPSMWVCAFASETTKILARLLETTSQCAAYPSMISETGAKIRLCWDTVATPTQIEAAVQTAIAFIRSYVCNACERCLRLSQGAAQ
jgi:hypothetical protein